MQVKQSRAHVTPGLLWRKTVILGAVCTAAWTQVHAQAVTNPYDQVRTSSFAYRADGLLIRETVEPDKPALCVSTSYDYDAQGNRKLSSTANCAGAPDAAKFSTRASRSTYAAVTTSIGGVSVAVPAGTFATNSKVAVSPGLTGSADPDTDPKAHTETREYDPRFGTLTRLVGPNGSALATTWQIDDFGRVIGETRADGTRTVTRHCYLAGRLPGGFDPQSAGLNSAGCPTSVPTEAPAAAIMFQHVEAQSSTGVKISAWVRTYIDAGGRTLRVATEAFDGSSQPAAGRGVVVQDTDYNAFGAVVVTTKPYFLATKSTRTGGSEDVGLTRTDYDHLGRPVKVYVSDPSKAGVSTPVNFRERGSRPAAVTTMVYNGLESQVIDDAGKPRTELKSADGKVVRVTDAYGASVVHHHDALGQLIQTDDALRNKIVIKYDLRGRKVRLEDPDAGATDYCYDALGQLKAQQTSAMRGNHSTSLCPAVASDGIVVPEVAGWTTLAYDRIGRLTERHDPDYKSTWYHDRDAEGAQCGASIGKTCQSSTNHGGTRRMFYDSLGRLVRTRADLFGGVSMATAATYDATSGRVDEQTYPSGLKVKNLYTSNGALRGLQSLTALKVGGSAVNALLWQATAVDAAGRAEKQLLGNGVEARASFDGDSGRLLRLTAGKGALSDVVDQQLQWNSLNRLVQRTDALGAAGTTPVAVTDDYAYDDLGRLIEYTVAGGGSPNIRSVQLQYNAAGMLLYKSDVGVYSYAQQGVAMGQPHALRSISGSHNSTYTYNRVGNLVTASGGKYRDIKYTSFNLPDSSTGLSGPGGLPRYTWRYDENRQRLQEVRATSAGTRTTWFAHPGNGGGLSFELEESPSGARQGRHYIGGIAVVVLASALPTIQANGLPPALADAAVAKLEYWHKDHLGSLIATTNHTGAVTARYSYDPFGKRRVANGSYDPFGTLVVDWGAPTVAGTDRGYTGHEHLDDAGVIHMNGRIFDPLIGRFMQADPLVQEPDNLQNYDRYAYCFNSPATCTDPSGYKSLRQLARAMDTFIRRPTSDHLHGVARSVPGQSRIDRFLMNNEFAYTVAKIVVAYFTFGLGSAGMDAYYTHERTGSATAAFKVGVTGMATNWAFNTVGTMGQAYGWGSATMVFAHALVGCASSEASGGNCGQGALAAGFGKAITISSRDFVSGFQPGVERIAVGTAVAAFSGGVAAELGGGKFSNGAQTAAMGYLFNECAHGGCGWNDTKVIIAGNYAAGPLGEYGTYPSSLHLEIRIQNSYDIITIEGQPGDYSVMKGLRLVSGSDSPHPAPVFSMELSVPKGMSMQQLATNLVDAAKAYQNNLPYNFPLAGTGTMMWGNNSNSYVSGVLMRATGQYQSGVVDAARRAGFLVPGFNKPMPIGPR